MLEFLWSITLCPSSWVNFNYFINCLFGFVLLILFLALVVNTALQTGGWLAPPADARWTEVNKTVRPRLQDRDYIPADPAVQLADTHLTHLLNQPY